MTDMNWLWLSLYHGFAMFWATLWALVLGFGISAALQVFVSKEQMNRVFGRTNLKTMLLATGLGAASSSCSYAAVAAGRSAFQRGAALIVALAFMFASTNLVVELGAVLWLLMGWQFVLAEVIGAFVLIGVMWLLMSIFFPKKLEQEARGHAESVVEECAHHHHSSATAATSGAAGENVHPPSPGYGATGDGGESTRDKWVRVANAFWMDWSMLWKEILGGFLIAGFLAVLVPSDWWKALFIESGSPALRLIENAAVGPIIAVLSFVCSVGNIPLASLLWSNGISFGGVIAFIYADLIVIPSILIYWKYFGGRAAIYITLIFYVSMVVAGVIVDLIFSAAGLIPQGARPPSAIEHATFQWNYTTWLDFAAIAVASVLLFLTLRDSKAHSVTS
jgi:uncharacterized membrane protein YraQ (UPF0718 family)